MKELVVSTYVTLDGVTETPEKWLGALWTPQMEEYAFNQVAAADALLLGRRTYEIFASSWPARSGHFAERINHMPKFVVSTTLGDPGWNNAKVIRDDVPRHLAELKKKYGFLIYGSGDLMHSLVPHALIDLYRFWVTPLVVGHGNRLFREGGDGRAFDLVQTETFDSGVTVLSYEPRPSPAIRPHSTEVTA